VEPIFDPPRGEAPSVCHGGCMSVTSEEPSTYELERDKPIPNENHGIVQLNLGAEFLKAKKSSRSAN